MIYEETNLSGAYLIDIEKIADQRGFFARAWCQNEFRKHNLISRFVQCNLSFNEKRNTLRGMHYQESPFEEVKLIRCIRGAVYDVIIDLRSESPTFQKWIGVDLTADNRKMLYVPENLAHGYLTLADDTEIFYQVSQFYSPNHERGVRWNDPAFDIDWPVEGELFISEKDNNWTDFVS